MDASQVAALLRTSTAQRSSLGAKPFKYTRGNNNLKMVRVFLENNGGLEDVLGGYIAYGALLLWQKRLPGFWNCS